MRVVFFHRKSVRGNFSIENLFRRIREKLPSDITWRVKEMRFTSRGFFRRLYACIEAARSQGDVNHITGDIHFIAIFLSKKSTVLTIHDVGFMLHSNPLARFILKLFWIQMPVSRCAVVTTVSETTKTEILKHVKIDAAKIMVIPNPIAPVFTAKLKPFNTTKPVLLQIGTKHNKNLKRLAEALHGVSCKVHIIGEPDDSTVSVFKKFAIDYSVFTQLTNEEVFAQYVGCDIVTFVSTLEGFGLPILEANAVGRVVITSNLSSMPEVAGDAALLVDPYNVESIRDGVKRLINDQSLRETLVRNGFKNLQRFDEQKIANQYANVYRQVLKNKS